MEWLGGTISKEDVGEDGTNARHSHNKRKRDDDGDDDALGALALRFKWVVFLPTLPLSITPLLGSWNFSRALKHYFKLILRRIPS